MEIEQVPAGGQSPSDRPPLAARAGQTTPENPWPLAHLSRKIKDYVDKMPATWIEAEVVEYKQRPANRMTFFVAKDLHENASMQIKAFGNVIAAAGPALDEGARVIMQVKPDYYTGSGSLAMMASEIRTVGLGELLVALERLRQRLDQEGLFSPARKKPLPFLPRRIGLICGRGAKAKDDVIVNATARWPGADFEIREVAVQGPSCPGEVMAALEELDAMEGIDVIVITRGGGAVEDLLGFSDEALVRAAAAARTPVVGAIGHETDTPLLDYVVDFRASTPTDAAKRIVPDLREQLEFLGEGRARMRAALGFKLQNAYAELAQIRQRPVMQNPQSALQMRGQELAHLLTKMRSAVNTQLAAERTELAQLRGTLRAISPQATLDRGYSVLRLPNKSVITDATQVKRGDLIEAMLANGSLVASVVGMTNSAQTQGENNG